LMLLQQFMQRIHQRYCIATTQLPLRHS
jgi:hypothetical protein